MKSLRRDTEKKGVVKHKAALTGAKFTLFNGLFMFC
jgi:hypothetical protein